MRISAVSAARFFFFGASLPDDIRRGSRWSSVLSNCPRSPRRRVCLWCRSAPRFTPAHLLSHRCAARRAGLYHQRSGGRMVAVLSAALHWGAMVLPSPWRCRCQNACFCAPLVDRTSVFDRTARGPSNEPLHPPNTLLTALACSARCTGWHGRGSRLGSTNRARRALS